MSENKKLIYHLDDDELIRHMWRRHCNRIEQPLVSCTSFEELLENLINAEKDVSIYLDHDLGVGPNGIEIAKELRAKGFYNLTLSTGYDADDIEEPQLFVAIVGKRPPF